MNQINNFVYVFAYISAELYMYFNAGSLETLLLCQFYCNHYDINCNVIAPDLLIIIIVTLSRCGLIFTWC